MNRSLEDIHPYTMKGVEYLRKRLKNSGFIEIQTEGTTYFKKDLPEKYKWGFPFKIPKEDEDINAEIRILHKSDSEPNHIDLIFYGQWGETIYEHVTEYLIEKDRLVPLSKTNKIHDVYGMKPEKERKIIYRPRDPRRLLHMETEKD